MHPTLPITLAFALLSRRRNANDGTDGVQADDSTIVMVAPNSSQQDVACLSEYRGALSVMDFGIPSTFSKWVCDACPPWVGCVTCMACARCRRKPFALHSDRLLHVQGARRITGSKQASNQAGKQIAMGAFLFFLFVVLLLLGFSSSSSSFLSLHAYGRQVLGR